MENIRNGSLYFTGFLLLLFCSCQVDRSDIVFTKEDSPHIIKKDLETREGQRLVMEPGAEVHIDTAVNIFTYGDILIEGTEEDPVIIKALVPGIGWGKISAKSETNNLRIVHAKISDGIITSYSTDNNYIAHVDFYNSQDLDWQTAHVRFWYGHVRIEHCTVNGVNKAEGFLFHDVQAPYVGYCHFENTPDAVEYINSPDGIIEHNVFGHAGDDAIDLNGCRGTIIRHNVILGNSDCGMEIGSENFGRSSAIVIEDNEISSCKKGIWIKESSEASASRITFKENQIAVAANTKKDSLPVSRIEIKESQFLDNDKDQESDEVSIIIIH